MPLGWNYRKPLNSRELTLAGQLGQLVRLQISQIQ